MGPVVVDMSIRPAGRNPLSRSSFDSYPTVWFGSAREEPAASAVRSVLRQTRILPSAAVTVMGRSVSLDMYSVPPRAFSGSPPLLGGENRGSRHVPVHSGDGSIFALSQVSL